MAGLAPILMVGAGLVVAYVVQSQVAARMDFRCGACGRRFSLSPLQATLAPHRMGSKWCRCPHCGARTWAEPVPKD
ncbi:MAG TPA: hypothetical protein VHO26_09575 [Propionibacteriaceae bacterium]|nr:hypothetical protein [Propionibacteriaceae bacterium]